MPTAGDQGEKFLRIVRSRASARAGDDYTETVFGDRGPVVTSIWIALDARHALLRRAATWQERRLNVVASMARFEEQLRQILALAWPRASVTLHWMSSSPDAVLVSTGLSRPPGVDTVALEALAKRSEERIGERIEQLITEGDWAVEAQ
jgi:hypothetical protein